MPYIYSQPHNILMHIKYLLPVVWWLGNWVSVCLSVCLFVTFVYCVETAKDTAIAAMECEKETVRKAFEWYNFQ